MLHRLKRAWKLSNKTPEALLKLTDEQIEAIPDRGDGKAVFISEGTIAEHEEYEKEKKGLKGIFGIGK